MLINVFSCLQLVKLINKLLICNALNSISVCSYCINIKSLITNEIYGVGKVRAKMKRHIQFQTELTHAKKNTELCRSECELELVRQFHFKWNVGN